MSSFIIGKKLRHATLGISALLLLAAVNCARAESPYGDFTIKDTPLVDYRQLQIILSGGSAYGGNSFDRPYLDPGLTSANITKTQKEQFSIDANPVLSFHDYSAKDELDFNLPFDFSFGTQSGRGEEVDWYSGSSLTSLSTRENADLQMGFNPRLKYSYYQGLFFINTDSVISGRQSINYDRTTYKYNSGSETTRKTTSEEYFVDIGSVFNIGLGRVFEGRYAFMAIQIIQDLQREKRLLKPASVVDMQDFSTLLTRIKTEYYFDSRRKKINDQQRIGDFLIERGYLERGDKLGILIAQDIYENTFSVSRTFGSRLGARFLGQLIVHNYETWTQEAPVPDFAKDELINYSYAAGLEYLYHEPLAPQWQLDIDVSCDYFPQEKNSSKHWWKENKQFITAILNAEIDYYPNTRLQIRLGALTNLDWDLSGYQEIFQEDYGATARLFREITFGESVSASISYSVSENVRWTLYALAHTNLTHLISGSIGADYFRSNFLSGDQIRYFLKNERDTSDTSWGLSFNIEYAAF